MRHKYVLELLQSATPLDMDGDKMDDIAGEISTETLSSLLLMTVSNQVEVLLTPIEAVALATILLNFATQHIK